MNGNGSVDFASLGAHDQATILGLRLETLAFDESKHPRDPAGVSTGGRWRELSEADRIELLRLRSLAFNPDQLRDYHGRWTIGGTGLTNIETQQLYKQEDGTYIPERQALHNAIIAAAFEGKTPVENPKVQLMGGGPGVGKTTALKSLDTSNHVFVSPDDIKAQLPEWAQRLGGIDAAALLHEESSDVSKMIMRRAAEGSYNIVIDGTGDNSLKSLVQKLGALRGSGYAINAQYVTTSIETALARAESRALKTGRLMAESVLRATHRAVSDIFPLAVTHGLFDNFKLWDSTTNPATLVVSGSGSSTTVHDQALWERFLAKSASLGGWYADDGAGGEDLDRGELEPASLGGSEDGGGLGAAEAGAQGARGDQGAWPQTGRPERVAPAWAGRDGLRVVAGPSAGGEGSLAFDESQHPRDDHGRWTGVVGTTLYHVTRTDVVSSIQKKGLLPMQTSNWVTAGSKERYGKGEIFAFESRADALRWAMKMDWTQNHELGTEKISIVHFKTGKNDRWVVDTADPLTQAGAKGKWLKQAAHVGPERILSSETFTVAMFKAIQSGASLSFDPSQPRKPKGDPEGGQWEKDGSLKGYLRMVEEMHHKLGRGGGIEGFVLKHGQEFKQEPQLPEGVKKKKLGLCYMNAYQTAEEHGLVYVEGFATIHGVPMEHAWCVDKDDRVVDPTWASLKGGPIVGNPDYFGVKFSMDYVRRTILAREKYGVLYNPEQGMPLLKKDSVLDGVFTKGSLAYDPNEARVPAGSPAGGRWTVGGGGARRFSNQNEADEWGRTTQSWTGRLTPDQEDALSEYTTYTGINDALRGKGGVHLPSQVEELRGLDEIFKDSDTVLKEDVVAHRVWMGPGARSKVGTEFVDKGFTSTALTMYALNDFKQAYGRKGVEVTIRIPAGMRAIYLGAKPTDWGPTRGWFAGSTELLLNRGTRYRVVQDRSVGRIVLEVVGQS